MIQVRPCDTIWFHGDINFLNSSYLNTYVSSVGESLAVLLLKYTRIKPENCASKFQEYSNQKNCPLCILWYTTYIINHVFTYLELLRYCLSSFTVGGNQIFFLLCFHIDLICWLSSSRIHVLVVRCKKTLILITQSAGVSFYPTNGQIDNNQICGKTVDCFCNCSLTASSKMLQSGR